LPFIVKKAKVDTTTMAALDERPEPAGTVDETSMSKPCGSDPPVGGKNWFRTPYEVDMCESAGLRWHGKTNIVSSLHVALPTELRGVDAELPFIIDNRGFE
jgi:hypothetical protein